MNPDRELARELEREEDHALRTIMRAIGTVTIEQRIELERVVHELASNARRITIGSWSTSDE